MSMPGFAVITPDFVCSLAGEQGPPVSRGDDNSTLIDEIGR
jgi:hypothetical protein